MTNVTLTNVLETIVPTGSGNQEVASDIEMVIAMAPGVTQVNVYEGSSDDVLIGAMTSTNYGVPLPNQISDSWGVSGDVSVEQSLLQMAAQGQTFFTACGDGGAFVGPDTTSSQYYANYQVYVGGTKLTMNGLGVSWSNEVVWDDSTTNDKYFASGGGVFTNVPIPEYQQGVSMALNGGSSEFRNFPDVTMVARDIQIFATAFSSNGTPEPGEGYSWKGTSAASPLWAGFLALVNQQAAVQGRPPVGFINPALYAIGEGQSYNSCFHDITSGNNTWFNTNTDTGSPNLYYATNGYNLCSGWGSPTGTNFINALVDYYSGPVFVDFNYNGTTNNGSYEYPFKTLAQGTNAVTQGGTIIIKTAGSTPETMKLAKPMVINAIGGNDTVGN